MVWHARASLLLLPLLPGACLRPGSYACEDAAQCKSDAGGACVDGWCAYPDGTCGSGLRFGERSPDDVAGSCVGATASGDSSGGSGPAGSSTDDGGPPASSCGNDVVDEGELCDDGNRLGGDGCHPQCVAPGTILWTATYDGEAHGDDRGFGMAIDPDGESFWVAGFTTVDDANGSDLLLQRRWIEDGSLVWTQSRDGEAHGEDIGEDVAIDAAGRPWLVGRITSTATAGDVWVGSFDRDGTPGASFTHDEQGGEDHGHGLAFTASGALVVVGVADLGPAGTPDAAAWMRRYSPAGEALGDAIILNGSTALDTALQVVADGDGFVVTGDLSTTEGIEEIWTARYDADDAQSWSQLAGAPDVGPYPRGVGIAPDGDGGWATAGVLSTDIWVQRYAADGTPGLNLVVAGTQDRQDEAADVAFLPDGRFIVVGFLDFGTVGFATSDAWVRVYAPDGTPEWTDVFDGESEEIDKALCVGVTDKLSAVVVGYETVPGQSRDVWMRHYAL